MKRFYIALVLVMLALVAHAQTALPQTAQQICPNLLGSSLPVAEVQDANGNKQVSTTVLAGKPFVLVVYRGGWCPFCSRQLADLGKIAADIKAAGYELVALSPDAGAQTLTTKEKGSLGYTLWSDPEGKLIKQLGLAYQVPKHYLGTIAKASDNRNDGFLPVPAVLVYNAKGQLQFSYVNPDFKIRLNHKVLLASLESGQ